MRLAGGLALFLACASGAEAGVQRHVVLASLDSGFWNDAGLPACTIHPLTGELRLDKETGKASISFEMADEIWDYKFLNDTVVWEFKTSVTCVERPTSLLSDETRPDWVRLEASDLALTLLPDDVRRGAEVPERSKWAGSLNGVGSLTFAGVPREVDLQLSISIIGEETNSPRLELVGEMLVPGMQAPDERQLGRVSAFTHSLPPGSVKRSRELGPARRP